MTTLTYGMQIPANGDYGSVFYPALAANFTQLDSHNHNGTNSPKITSLSLSPTTLAVLASAWVLVANGIYRQAVTVPAGLSFDTTIVSFRDTSSGNYYDLSIEKITAGQFYVYINDATLNLTAYFGV